MNRAMLTAVALALPALALATLPPPDEAAKAKAAEAAAKTAWQGKVEAYKLCQVQNRIAAAYKKGATGGTDVKAGDTKTVAATTKATPKKPEPTSATASQGGGTPVADVAPNAAVAVPACADPGPFAYAPPEQKPLESSGAHSPAANATSPPSVRSNSAEMAPTKPGVATKK
jgi:hypothetical protein